jgi:hypothetical protein
MNVIRLAAPRRWAWLAVLPLAGLQAGELSRTHERSIPLKPGGTVSVEVASGDVTVRAVPGTEVKLKAVVRVRAPRRKDAEALADRAEPEVTVSGDRVEIREPDWGDTRDSGFFDFDWDDRRGGISMDVDVSVPEGADLEIAADEGRVSVSGVLDRVSVSADEGSFIGENLTVREADLSVDEGDVRIEGVQGAPRGALRIEADEGDLRIAGAVLDLLEVRADEGSVVIRDGRMRTLRVSADEGDLRADLRPEPSGDYTLEADEGEVQVSLPAEASVDLELETSDGRVDSDFRLPVENSDAGERARGRLGSGGARMSVFTEEGDIVVIRKAAP